ncbi:DNA circularization protein [Pseudomonas huaxiensis]|uniref:DNA circularization protein n=1 Tax=Pseudomonas huaxiensis TaxID=2213017 RepID=UPI000DA678CE|nr:DNA circularization N-terminal domain-containing protein [Pseudomonas huaxiensis]
MSWSETLLDASFRGVPLEVMTESLGATRELAQHGVPYRDGDDVEDMGRKAREFSMTVVLYGTNYEISLQNLLAALDVRGAGELIHPIYGRVDVLARNWKVDHSAERPDYAQVDLQFVERTPSEPFFARQFEFVDEGVLTEDQGRRWQDGLLDLIGQIDALIAEVQQLIGGGWIGLLENLLGLPGIALRLQQFRSQILGVIAGLASLFGRSAGSQFDPLLDLARTPTEIRAAISAHIDPSVTSTSGNSAFAITTVTDAVDMSSSGSVLEQNTAALNLINQRLVAGGNLLLTFPGAEAIEAQPARTGTTLLSQAQLGLAPAAALLASVPVGGLVFGSESMLSPTAAVAWSLVMLVVTEAALAQASAVIVLLDEQRQKPTLTPEQLQSVVSSTRSLTDAAIQLHRQLLGVEEALHVIEPLRAIAGIVQAAGRQVLQLRPPLVERQVAGETNLRLLAHHWYGDHSRAAELLRLNPGLRTPYAINAGEVLRVYTR